MKLVIQIASGIFVAGALSWVFWFGVLSAAVITIPQKTIDVSRMITETAPIPLSTQRSAPATVATPTCVNFVQKANHEKHCLEDLHSAWRIESATLPPHRPTPAVN